MKYVLECCDLRMKCRVNGLQIGGIPSSVGGLGAPLRPPRKIAKIEAGENQVYSNKFRFLPVEAANAQRATIIRGSLVPITTVK